MSDLKIKRYRYVTKGLYEWGSGWLSADMAKRWKEFWDNAARCRCYPTACGEVKHLSLLRVILPDMENSCHMLYTIGGIIYLHPMSGQAYFEKGGARMRVDGVDVDPYFEEFRQVITDAVEYANPDANVHINQREYALEVVYG